MAAFVLDFVRGVRSYETKMVDVMNNAAVNLRFLLGKTRRKRWRCKLRINECIREIPRVRMGFICQKRVKWPSMDQILSNQPKHWKNSPPPSIKIAKGQLTYTKNYVGCLGLAYFELLIPNQTKIRVQVYLDIQRIY